MRKIAFTGHRLDKLPYKNESDPNCATLKRKLFCEAQKHLLPDQTIYLSGMANGVDLWAANKALRDRYRDILGEADKVILISEEYTLACMHVRNRRLVDEADHLIAVYDGKQQGGTRETIVYARRKGLDITIIEP